MNELAKKKGHRRPGNFVAIPLSDGTVSFGRELREGVVGFYDLRSDSIPELDEIEKAPTLFKVSVMDRAIRSGRWRVIGNKSLRHGLEKPTTFFMQDATSGEFSIYREGAIRPATEDQCRGLERAAVWDPEHVEDRSRDHYAGRTNIWVNSLKPKHRDRN